MIVIDNENSLQDQGVWTDFAGSKFKIAHAGNMLFQRTLNRLQLPHRRQIERGNIDPAISHDILCKAISKGLLLDWKDVVNSKGEQMAYTEELGAQALKNNTDLREYVQEFASDLENYRIERINSEGNS